MQKPEIINSKKLEIILESYNPVKKEQFVQKQSIINKEVLPYKNLSRSQIAILLEGNIKEFTEELHSILDLFRKSGPNHK